MRFGSNSGFSLIEIGIALVIVGIFMTASITLLSASNENYRRTEQLNIAKSYAIKTIEAILLSDEEISIAEIQNNAKIENNMDIEYEIENLPPKNGNNYGDKIQLVSVNVSYHIKSEDAGSIATFPLKTIKIND